MRDRDPEQLNKKDDLVDVKELVRSWSGMRSRAPSHWTTFWRSTE